MLMNYLRIYENFIKSRRQVEKKLLDSGEYKEVHHILPRSLGGNNDLDNLISLTPEDHYFAHLLLAKIYGGKLWAALFLMSSRCSKQSLIVGRRAMYGYARKQWSLVESGKEGLKGSDNGNHNPEVFSWINLDTGLDIKSTMHDMWVNYGGSRGKWTQVVSGQRNTMLGWTIDGRNIRIRGNKNKIHTFINRNGETFTGTQKQFCLHTGISVASASRVCRHGDVTVTGWRLYGVIDRNHTNRKSDGLAAQLHSGKTFVLINDKGDILKGTRQQIASAIGKNVSCVSSSLNYLKKNQNGSCYGYKLKEII